MTPNLPFQHGRNERETPVYQPTNTLVFGSMVAIAATKREGQEAPADRDN